MKVRFMSLGSILIIFFSCFQGIYILIPNVDAVVSGNTYFVGGSGAGNYSHIQWAIDNATSGDTIYIYKGTYYETLKINKSINLVGESKETIIIDGGKKGNVIFITAKWVNISGLEITNSGGYFSKNKSGIKLMHISFITIKDCKISNNYFGIDVEKSSYVNIMNNEIVYNEGTGLFIQASFKNNILGNNVSFNNGTGIYLDESTTVDNEIDNNTIFSNIRDGIVCWESSRNEIIFNNIQKNGGGIYLFSSNNNLISNNKISNNNWDGITFSRASIHNIISNNIVNYNQQDGVFLEESSSDNVIKNNFISNNYNGIYISISCNNNLLTNNNISMNNENGIKIRTASDNDINVNNIYYNNKAGIYISSTFKASSNNNIFNNNLFTNSIGIYIDSTSHTSVDNNDVSNNLHGIYFIFSYNNYLSYNNLFNNLNGIELQRSYDNELIENKIIKNGEGIILNHSYNNNIVENNVSSNIKNGIVVYNSDGNIFNTNKINFNGKSGIFLEASSNDNVISSNYVLFNNQNGISLKETYDNTIDNNEFCFNDLSGIRSHNSQTNNIKNNKASFNKNYGIYLSNGLKTKINYNSINYNNYSGIYLYESRNIEINYNQVELNNDFDISIESSMNSKLSNNTMINGGIYITGNKIEHWNRHNIEPTNKLNGKSVYYWKNKNEGRISEDVGEIILANCTNIRIENQNLNYSSIGIILAFSSENIILNNTLFFNKKYGIYFYNSNTNTLINNSIINNNLGINFESSNNNQIYLNNFIDNIKNVNQNSSKNTWNNIYPYGGNYWSDYSGKDLHHGSLQNLKGSDGFGDIPYSIDTNDKDKFPLMHRFDSKKIPYPQQIRSTSGNSYVNITWNPPVYGCNIPITNYQIYRSTKSGETCLFKKIGNVLYFNDTDVINGIAYYYRIGAMNDINEGELSKEVKVIPSTIPSKPLNIKITPGNSFINIQWDQPTSDGGQPINTYKIYKSEYPGNKILNFEVGNVYSFNDTNVTNGLTYSYLISAINERGEGPISNETIVILPTVPGVPEIKSIFSGDSYINITWDPPKSNGGYPISNYFIHRNDILYKENIIMQIENITNFNDTSVINGITYYYRISASNYIGEGFLSNEVTATPSIKIEPKQFRIKANITNGYAPLTISFDAQIFDVNISILSFFWDFGDGNFSKIQNPEHTFQINGSFEVKLTIFDVDNISYTDTIQITVYREKIHQEQFEESEGKKEKNVKFTSIIYTLIFVNVIIMIILAIWKIYLKKKKDKHKKSLNPQEKTEPTNLNDV